MDKEHRQMYARLVTLCAIKEAQFNANPEAFRKQMSRQLNHALKTIDEVYYALSPMPLVEVAESSGIQVMDIQGEALIRCNAALKTLRDAGY